MTLEAATFVSELSSSNPSSSDLVKQGDDHIRLVKAALKATFPNAGKAIFFETNIASGAAPTLISADSGKSYPIDCAGGAVSVNLPISPDDNTWYKFFKSDFTINKLTISGNGNTINGLTSVDLLKPYQFILVRYSLALGGWIADIDHVTETGTFIDNGAAALSEAILCDGTITLGNTSSGADKLGNRFRPLYEHLWATYTYATCPQSGGGARGASAAADWAANRRITMPALNGRVRLTQDNQGGLTAGIVTAALAGFDANASGVVGGSVSGTLIRSDLPQVTITVDMVEAPHTHTVNGGSTIYAGTSFRLTDSGGSNQPLNPTAITIDSAKTNVSGSIKLNGDVTQTKYNKMMPVFVTKTHMAL